MMNEIVSKLCGWLVALGSHIIQPKWFSRWTKTNVSLL